MSSARTPPVVAKKPRIKSDDGRRSSLNFGSPPTSTGPTSVPKPPSPYNNGARSRTNTTPASSTSLRTSSPPPPLPDRNQKKSQPIVIESNAVTLEEYLLKNSRKLPATVFIETGFYGNASLSSIYEEKMVAHFEMRVKVVRATFDKGGTYHIPLMSAIEFSLLHNPNDNLQQAQLGHYYETVGHILAQQIRPLVVCVTIPYNSADVSISEGEILAVSPRIHSKTFKAGKFIKCISVATGEQKLLHENVKGGFTTQPERIKLPLSVIWGNRYFQPPLKVIMYHTLPHLVLQKDVPVTLLSTLWEDAIIVTKEKPTEQKKSETGDVDHYLLRIRKDTGISILTDDTEPDGTVMKLQDEATVKKVVDYKLLCEKTRDMFHSFNYPDINQHIFPEDPVWPSFEEVQSYLYKHIMEDFDYWKDHIQLKRPENAFKGLKRAKSKDSGMYENVSTKDRPRKDKTDDYSTLEPVDLKTIEAPDDVDILYAPVQGSKFQPPPAEIPDVAHLLHEVNTANRQIMIEVDKLKAEMEGLKMELRQTKQIMGHSKRDLSETMRRLETEITSLKEDYVDMEKSPLISTELEHQRILKNLTPEQLVEALEKLGLKQHIPEFERRQLTGLELTQCDEQILTNELNVTGRIDMIRIMMFIEGRGSVWKILEKSGCTFMIPGKKEKDITEL